MVDDKLPANRYELRMHGEDTKVFGSAEKVAAAFHAADVEKLPSVHRFVRGQAEAVVARTGPRLAPEYLNGDALRILKVKQVDPVPPEGERFRDAYYATVDASLRMRLESIENLMKVQPTHSNGVWKLDKATYNDLEALAFTRPELARQAWMDCVGTRFDAPTLVDYETGQVVTLADTASLVSARILHEYRFGIDLNGQQVPQHSEPREKQLPVTAKDSGERVQSPGNSQPDTGQQKTIFLSEQPHDAAAMAPPAQSDSPAARSESAHADTQPQHERQPRTPTSTFSPATEPKGQTVNNSEHAPKIDGKHVGILEVDRITAPGVPDSYNVTALDQQGKALRNAERLSLEEVERKFGPEAARFAGDKVPGKGTAWYPGVDMRLLPPALEPRHIKLADWNPKSYDAVEFRRHNTPEGVKFDIAACSGALRIPCGSGLTAEKLADEVGKKLAKLLVNSPESEGRIFRDDWSRPTKAVKSAGESARVGSDTLAAVERPTPANSVEPAHGLAYAIDGSAVESLKFNRRGKGADQVVDLQGFNGNQQVIEAKAVPVTELARVVGEAAAQHITSAKGRSGTLKGEAAPSPVEPPVLGTTAAARAGKATPQQAPAAAPQPRPAAPAGGQVPAAGPSDTVTLEVMRRGQRETIGLQTGSNRELGLTMRPLQGDEARAAGVAGGLLVGGVSGAANRAGVLPGDVLVAVNGTPVSSADEARAAAAKQAPAPANAPAQQAAAPAQQPAAAAPPPAPVIEEPPAVKARREAECLAVDAIKSSLEERFIVRPGRAADSTEYRFRGEPGVLAFVDRGSKLATDRNEADVARGIVDLAQAKDWKGLALAGTEDFRRNVWREAAARGLPASGYTPTKADQEWVAARQGVQQSNTVAKADTQQPAPQQAPQAQRPAQPAAAVSQTSATAQQGPTKTQVMNAMRAGLRDLKMDKASSDRIMERLSVRLDGLLAQGKPLPNIARYDRAAVSRMPEFAARQAQQQGQAQARARAR